jgi:SAM-dependent methyltransferase
MIIKISKDLKNQEIHANGVELASIMGFDRKAGKRVLTFPDSKKVFVHSFSSPVLMTDNYKISKLSPTLRDTLFSLYNSRPRIVEYDGVSTFWDSSHINVWCPSIDTILFAKALRDIMPILKKSISAIEIGCGSGFLSKYLLQKLPGLKSLVINDLNPYAIKSARDNIDDPRTEFFIGDGLKKLNGKKYDLIICNPPYVPRQGSIDDNPYEGIGLLNHLVHQGSKYLNPKGIIVTNVSSLCWLLVMKNKPSMKLKIIASMDVPLKVNNILNNKEWLSYLRKIGLKKKMKDGYEYWQKIVIVMLQNS